MRIILLVLLCLPLWMHGQDNNTVSEHSDKEGQMVEASLYHIFSRDIEHNLHFISSHALYEDVEITVWRDGVLMKNYENRIINPSRNLQHGDILHVVSPNFSYKTMYDAGTDMDGNGNFSVHNSGDKITVNSLSNDIERISVYNHNGETVYQSRDLDCMFHTFSTTDRGTFTYIITDSIGDTYTLKAAL